MHSGRKVGLGLVLTLLLAVFMVSPVGAVAVKSGDMLTIEEGKTTGPLFISGNYVTVNADVDGDVFVAAQSVTINGTVNGDVIAAAQSITVKGSVNGDVRGAANQIDIQGQIMGSVTAAANNIEVRDQAVIGRDVLGFGNSIGTTGRIDGQLMGSAAEVRINGMVNGAVTLWNVQSLSLGPAAVVKDTINYGSPKPATISPQAQINGISWQEKVADVPKQKTAPGFSWLNALGWIAAGLLLWAICYWISPPAVAQYGRDRSKSSGKHLGLGIFSSSSDPPGRPASHHYRNRNTPGHNNVLSLCIRAIHFQNPGRRFDRALPGQIFWLGKPYAVFLSLYDSLPGSHRIV